LVVRAPLAFMMSCRRSPLTWRDRRWQESNGDRSMKTFLLAPLILAAFGATTACAGGRPVMYVVVDRVETTQDQSSISMIRIWGSFTRDNPRRNNFSKPIDGYIQFGRGSDKEAPKWQKAAGTGKAVLVGCCGGAGAFETVVIHPATEK